MDRNKRKINYTSSSGTRLRQYEMYNSTRNALSQKKQKKRLNPVLNRLLSILLVVVIAAAAVFFAVRFINGLERKDIGKATRIGATLSQNVMPFGNNVIFYDGTTFHCVSASGGNEWSYQIGQNADYDATTQRVVAWTGNDIYILNDKGRLIYNNKMTDSIQFASAGEEYIAVFIGDPDEGVISVINTSGQMVDSISISGMTVLDIGFFKSATTSSTAETELMWVLGLNTSGTVISTELQTYQPGKLSTGKSNLGEHLAYKVFYSDGALNVVDTRQISYYNYRVLETKNSDLIYGYTLQDVKTIRNNTYKLLVPDKEISSGNQISNIRLMDSSSDKSMHIPGECLAVALGTKSVYGFSDSTVYVCRYGEMNFKSYASPVNITAMLGMITYNRAVVASGSDIYVLELPY